MKPEPNKPTKRTIIHIIEHYTRISIANKVGSYMGKKTEEKKRKFAKFEIK